LIVLTFFQQKTLRGLTFSKMIKNFMVIRALLFYIHDELRAKSFFIMFLAMVMMIKKVND